MVRLIVLLWLIGFGLVDAGIGQERLTRIDWVIHFPFGDDPAFQLLQPDDLNIGKNGYIFTNPGIKSASRFAFGQAGNALPGFPGCFGELWGDVPQIQYCNLSLDGLPVYTESGEMGTRWADIAERIIQSDVSVFYEGVWHPLSFVALTTMDPPPWTQLGI